MLLIAQVLAILAGGVLLARTLTVLSPLPGRIPAAGVGVAGALVAGALFVYKLGSRVPEVTRVDSTVSSFAAQHAADPNANNAFFAWASREIRARGGRDVYYLAPSTALTVVGMDQWSTYALLPARETSKLSEADWIVFYGVKANLSSEQRRQFGVVAEFSPGFALALRSDAR